MPEKKDVGLAAAQGLAETLLETVAPAGRAQLGWLGLLLTERRKKRKQPPRAAGLGETQGEEKKTCSQREKK